MPSTDRPETTPALGRYGIFRSLSGLDTGTQRDIVATLDELGYGTLWLGNTTIEEAAPLVGSTPGLTIATGIQSIWRTEPAATARHFAHLESEHPGRFLLGLGVSHPQLADAYRRPYTAMVEYLDGLDDRAAHVAPAHRMLAALGPRMLRLARERTAGAFPYLVTVDQVAEARATLGNGPLLAPELGVVVEEDPGLAREFARRGLARYLLLDNYRKNWLRGGFTEEDLADGGSDRLVDALFAWGNGDRIRAKLREFESAGADHLVLQVFDGDEQNEPPHQGWRDLAELLR